MDFHLTTKVKNRRSRCQTAFEGRNTLTPPSLAKKMVGRVFEELPSDSEVLAKKTFLDPACGTGIFGAVVFDYLFNGLEDYISDPNDRARHIARSQIWMCDDSLAQVEAARELFPDFFEPKIIERDTLNYDWDMDFDFIGGNPPYEAPQEYEDKKGGGTALWTGITEKMLGLLKEDGYMAFIHPPLWRKPQSGSTWCSDLQPKMFSRNIEFLSIHDTSDGKATFNAGTRYDWYILQNREYEAPTIVNDERGNLHQVNFKNWSFLPNHSFNLVSKLAPENGEESCEVLGDYTFYEPRKNRVSREKKKDFVNPIVHSITKTNGITYTWTNDTSRYFGRKKVILSESSQEDVVIDKNGKYGISNNTIGLPFKNEEEAKKIKKAILSETFEEVKSACKWSDYRLSRKLFKQFKEDWYETVLEIEKNRNDD